MLNVHRNPQVSPGRPWILGGLAGAILLSSWLGVVGFAQPASRPASQPASQPVVPAAQAPAVYQHALTWYLASQQLLSQDQHGRVYELLSKTVAELAPLAQRPDVRANYEKLAAGVEKLKGQNLAATRLGFKEISTAMIDLGNAITMPRESQLIHIYHCPMARADWLQPFQPIANPYYGSKMLDCGVTRGTLAVQPLTPASGPTSQPAR